MSLNFAKVAMNLEIKVPHESLQRHLPASPEVVGEELALQVQRYARENGLGYYPALDYFQQNGGVDKDLLDAAESISWLASEMVCNEIRLRLRAVYSSLQFESVQTVAFTMPKVRTNQTNALTLLSEHFTPDVIKLNLVTTLVQKQADEQAAEHMAKSILCRWLKDRFSRLDVNSVNSIETYN